MTVRRLVVVAASLAVLTVGCGVAAVSAPAPSEGANVAPQATAGPTTPGGDSTRLERVVVATTTAPTTTTPTTTLAAATSRGPVRSRTASAGRAGAAGKPEHLKKRIAERVQEPVAVSPSSTESVPSPSETPPVADPPRASATLTVTVTTTPPPADTAPAAATTEPPAEAPPRTTLSATAVAAVASGVAGR
jgi:hypothetical protein